jgi:outer membrane lipoprotein SlyB
MNRLLAFLLLLFFFVGCQTSLTLSLSSRKSTFEQASRGCRAGENVIMLRSGGVVNARQVQFRPDSIHWILRDGTVGGAALGDVQRVQNTDHVRGVKEGQWIGTAMGLMTGGLIAGMATESIGLKSGAPAVLIGVTTLVVGPLIGGSEGKDRGSHLTILVDSTANKKR